MEQHNQEIGTRRDLVLYRLETARNDLKSARALFSIENCASHSRYFSDELDTGNLPFCCQLSDRDLCAP